MDVNEKSMVDVERVRSPETSKISSKVYENPRREQGKSEARPEKSTEHGDEQVLLIRRPGSVSGQQGQERVCAEALDRTAHARRKDRADASNKLDGS